ncbi:hypothetical protein SEA_JAMS_31 [Gordonia phage Jams]|uniref:DUF7233 domain-containing protein n=2 Tax=Woesvirus woes TaxID=1982751 RepID=A0A411B4N0_9CAUD|nr:hypothetical protein SEA_HELLO_31 [Gordonia phage Hello]QDF16891.1 hypothetical protein SEA_TEAL_31 [Gordonia phage Teal]UVK60269.1 hypothetical protein SEA_SHELLEY_31 [Gordonia phage Shelley]UVK60759.1 hypothetical protein SEA_BIANMAT_31 [Gordonia phage Bianmat]UVK61737.1 hypothetical protein SEA_MRWORMIE_31 [Gordonia phage MrWormie]UVK62759.1 hypothetical protein SEA_LIDONG_31 [Gordonia phage Lidong]UXE04913.1 hypothetical protein SEA_JAMS_31 [Gordonia phage Jams]UYL87202.1 hypothetical
MIVSGTMTMDVSEGSVIIPLGSSATASNHPEYDIQFSYDYGPFADPNAPAFDFLADRLETDGTITRNLECTSLPGRVTIAKV